MSKFLSVLLQYKTVIQCSSSVIQELKTNFIVLGCSEVNLLIYLILYSIFS